MTGLRSEGVVVPTKFLINKDVPHDKEAYTDASGHTYDFGFGLNRDGVLQDERVVKYVE